MTTVSDIFYTASTHSAYRCFPHIDHQLELKGEVKYSRGKIQAEFVCSFDIYVFPEATYNAAKAIEDWAVLDYSQRSGSTNKVRITEKDGVTTFEAKSGRKWFPIKRFYCGMVTQACIAV